MKRETAQKIYKSCLATKGVGTCECNYDAYIEECINDELIDAVGHFSNYNSSGPEAFAFHCFINKVSTMEQLSELLAYTYSNSGRCQGFAKILPPQIIVNLFKNAIPQCLMSQEEFLFFQELPNEIEIFRGGVVFKNKKQWFRDGVSWTMDINTAKFFAERNYSFFREHTIPTVCKAVIKKQDVIAYFNERNENELICDTSSISKVSYKPIIIENVLATT